MKAKKGALLISLIADTQAHALVIANNWKSPRRMVRTYRRIVRAGGSSTLVFVVVVHEKEVSA